MLLCDHLPCILLVAVCLLSHAHPPSHQKSAAHVTPLQFHWELSHIELHWGQDKQFARQNCDYTFSGLKRMVPRALDSVSVDTIRRNARHCFRSMDAYRRGLPAKLAAYAVKKYKSHRRIPEDVDWEALENDAKDATL